MRVVLELKGSPKGRLEGTAAWVDQPEPAPFGGVLELLALLETATGVRPDDTEWRTYAPGGPGGAS
jgi:hypothetical protein